MILTIFLLINCNTTVNADVNFPFHINCSFGLGTKQEYNGVLIKWILENYELDSPVSSKNIKIHRSSLLGNIGMSILTWFVDKKMGEQNLIVTINRCANVINVKKHENVR